MRLSGQCLIAVGVIALGSSAMAATPLGTAFTYQGRLKDNGTPPTGIYDLSFSLFADAAGGAAVSGPVTLEDVSVTDGFFTVQLDFGANAFNGEDRWLELAVKPGVGGAFATLAPRQLITVAPYALQSRGMYVDQNRNVTLGDQFYITQSPKFAGVGRNTRISSAEVFGLSATAAAGAYGGMYINTSDVGGLPFYGYATAGAPKAWSYLDGNDGNKWKLAYPALFAEVVRLCVDNTNARVGINTTTPENTLHVYKASAGAVTGYSNAPLIVENSTHCYINLLTPDASERGILFGSASDNVSGGIIYNSSSLSNGFQFRTNGNTTRMTLNQSGNLGINVANAGSKLQILTNDGTQGFSSLSLGTNRAGTFQIINPSTTSNALYVTTTSNNAAALFVQGIGAAPAIEAIGTTKTDVLEVTGADVAERFPASEETEPGIVMAIDKKNPGKLCIARGAYNRCVAGVVSGANNLSAGAILGNLPGHENAPAIALSGRVWVKCDATERAIEPGDLLTTSDLPGHAMAVHNHDRASGATLGKAMTELEKGSTGLVLVLVNLQ